MNTPLTPALIAEQLAICDSAKWSTHDAPFICSAAKYYRAALEMAARVEELEREVRVFAGAHADVAALCDRERAENAKLRMNVAFRNREITRFREALRFYGDAKRYAYGGDMGRALHSLDCDVVLDAGERARKALGE